MRGSTKMIIVGAVLVVAIMVAGEVWGAGSSSGGTTLWAALNPVTRFGLLLGLSLIHI